MERIGIRELNQHTSRYIARVKAGETIEVTEHGRLVARLVPAPRGTSKLEQLIAEGRVRPATRDLRSLPPPGEHDGLNVAEWLAADREDERY